MIVKSYEKKENSKAEITVQFTAEEFESALNNAYQNAKADIMIPGFRKGKVPRTIVEKMYGAKVFYEDAYDELLPQGLDLAVKEKELTTVGQPAVTNINVADDKSVDVTYSVALYPEVEMGEYKGVHAYKPAITVTDTQVDAEIENTRKRNARIQPIEGRPAQDGDVAVIDFEGFVDGVAFEGGKGENYELTIGSNTFIPGFEPQIIGMEIGEEKDINVTFPHEYTPELADKDAVFHIKLNDLKENILPDLDDDFAMDVSEFDTMAEYRDSVKKELEDKAKEDSENIFRENVMRKVIDGMTADIPVEMVDERVDSTIRNYENNFRGQGMSFDDYLKYMGMEREDFRKSIRPSAEQQIKTDLAFEKVAALESFELAEEEIEAEYALVADEYKMEVEKVKEFIPRESIKTQLQVEKARDLIFSTAVAEDKPDEVKAEIEKKLDEAKADAEAATEAE